MRAAPDGRPEQLRPGAARIALATGAPVVAVGLAKTEGAGRAAPERWRRLRLRAHLSAPLDLLEALGLDARQPDPSLATVEAATTLLAALLADAVEPARNAAGSRGRTATRR